MTEYYPDRRQEVTRLLHGDCLDILPSLPEASVELIYADPPFATGQDYGAFDDRWRSLEEYLQYIEERVRVMRRVLKPTGSIYLHCDDNANAHLRLMLDAIFGREAYRNEIVWKRTTGRSDAKRFARVSDRILYYALSGSTWNAQYTAYSDSTLKQFRHRDERGQYRGVKLTIDGGLSGGGYEYEFHGQTRTWGYPEHRMLELEAQGRIHIPRKMGGVPERKLYLHEAKGVAITDFVSDIPMIPRNERTGYPTQKPLALLELLIKASSNEGDIVLDPFCGSGTTMVAAAKLGRRFIGMDQNDGAIELSRERLARLGYNC